MKLVIEIPDSIYNKCVLEAKRMQDKGISANTLYRYLISIIAYSTPLELDFKRPKKIVGKLISADVLDKIRAEIDEYKSRQLTLAIGVDDLEKGKQIALEYVLAILDKYKAESEE